MARAYDEVKRVRGSNLVDTDSAPNRADSVLDTHTSPIVGKDLVASIFEHRYLVGVVDKTPTRFEVTDLAGRKVQGEVLSEHGVHFLVPVKHRVQPVVLAKCRFQPEVLIWLDGTKESADTEHQVEA